MMDMIAVERAVASFGLDVPVTSFQPPDDVWPTILSSLLEQRLTGLAMAAADAGVLQLTPAQHEALDHVHESAMIWTLVLERTLLRIAESFEAERIRFVVLKGPVLAHTVYADPSLRPFGDLDLLVGTNDWPRACAVLETLGIHRRLPEPRTGFDARFGKAAVHLREDGLEIDLHRTFVVGPVGLRIDAEEVAERSWAFELGGRKLLRLEDTAILLNACLHAVLGWRPPLLVPLRDVAELQQSPDVDWQLLADWAKRWKLRGILGRAFQCTSETLGVSPPNEALPFVEHTMGWRERRRLDAYMTARRDRGGTALSTFGAIPGVRNKMAYARALLAPNRDFLAARSGAGTSGAYLRRWTIPLRWVMGRTR